MSSWRESLTAEREAIAEPDEVLVFARMILCHAHPLIERRHHVVMLRAADA